MLILWDEVTSRDREGESPLRRRVGFEDSQRGREGGQKGRERQRQSKRVREREEEREREKEKQKETERERHRQSPPTRQQTAFLPLSSKMQLV